MPVACKRGFGAHDILCMTRLSLGIIPIQAAITSHRFHNVPRQSIRHGNGLSKAGCPWPQFLSPAIRRS